MNVTQQATAVRNEGIRVLHIDADGSAADGLATALEQQNSQFDVTTTPPETGLDQLETEPFDCLVSSYQLGETNGVALFEAVREQADQTPFILHTDGEIAAETAFEAGVSGYVRGDQPAVLANRIEREVDRDRSQRTAREIETTLDATQDGIAVFDSDGQFQYLNKAYASFYGYRVEELVGEGWDQLYPDSEIERYRDTVVPTLDREGSWIGDCECLHRDGFQFRSTHSISRLEDGGHVCVIHSGSVAASEF